MPVIPLEFKKKNQFHTVENPCLSIRKNPTRKTKTKNKQTATPLLLFKMIRYESDPGPEKKINPVSEHPLFHRKKEKKILVSHRIPRKVIEV